MSLTFGSLFAGIGGLDLGLQRAGMICKWQVEIDAFAGLVLTKHWPAIERHADIREFDPRERERVDLICGGFPCQDISGAGKKIGIEGERSGLWSEYLRVVRLLRPRFVLVENVSALLIRGLDRVLGDLAESGYDAEWHCLSAAGFGGYHLRRRIFILAYPNGYRRTPIITSRGVISTRSGKEPQPWARQSPQLKRAAGGRVYPVPDPIFKRMADGFRRGLDEDRLRVAGNAVVPDIAEWIGRKIIEAA